MIIQNQEISGPYFFVDSDWKKICTIEHLHDAKLDKNIYFNPSSYPRLNRYDSRGGSCFEGWHVPTPAVLFNSNDDIIDDIIDLDTDLSLDEYKNYVDQEICQTLTQLYDENEIINLMYSGGLDSTVLLAYIMHMGLTQRTRLVCINNVATDHPKSLKHNKARQDAINQFFATVKDQFYETKFETTGLDGIIDIVNSGRDYFHLQNYTTSTLYDRYENQTWLGGQYGNRTLLHEYVFLDQIRINHPDKSGNLKKRIKDSWQHAYNDSINRLDFDLPAVHLKWVSHAMKTFNGHDGYRGNYLHMPVGTNAMFQRLRRLDFDTVPIDLIAEASFGKEIIYAYQPDLLNFMNKQQSSFEFSTLDKLPKLPVESLDYAQLKVPENLNHDPEGLQWIKYALDQGLSTGEIEINTVVSIKNLQNISTQINKNSNAGIGPTSDQIDA